MTIFGFSPAGLDQDERVRALPAKSAAGDGGVKITAVGIGKEALLEQITSILHQAVKNLSQNTHVIPANRIMPALELSGKKVLIIDDDIRNIFALNSVLERHGMSVVKAESGKDGIEMLDSDPSIAGVLIDIMMPELDGYDTIRIVRNHEAFKDLPIIAVTAKAMKGDREKCIDAGASDYIAKPINIEQLLSLLRVRLAERSKAMR